MQINLFNGGLSTRLLPHLIQANEAVECTNVDTSKGALVPLKNFKDLNRKVANNIYNFKGLWIDTDENRDYVEYQEKLFYSNGVGRPQWSPDGARFFNVGIDAPKEAPVLGALTAESFTEWEVFSLPAASGREYLLEQLYFDKGFTLPYTWPSGVWYTYALFKRKTEQVWALCKLPYINNTTGDPSKLMVSIQSPVYDVKVFVSRDPENLSSFKSCFLDRAMENYFFVYYTGLNENLSTVENFFELETVNYIAVWRDESGAQTIEAFQAELTDEDKAGKALGGIKVKKKPGKTLQLFREGFKVELQEDDSYYYDTQKPTQISVESVLSALQAVRYVYTYYSSYTGQESGPSPEASIPGFAGISYVNIKVEASPDLQVDKIRIYRFGGNLTSFTLVAEIENFSSSYQDSTPDKDLTADLLPTSTYNPAPTGLKYLTTSNAMLFGALEDKLYYSNVGDPFFWDGFSFIDFENTITGIGATPNGLLVFTKDKTFIVTGNSPSTLSKFLLSPAIGCVLHKSIRTMANFIVWLSKDGLYASTGGSLEPLSRNLLGDFDFKNPLCSEVKGERYFLSYQHGTLLMDLRFGQTFVSLKERFKGLHVSESEVYGCDDNNNLVKLFGADDYLPIEYTSPIYSDGSISTIKVYTGLNAYVSGELSLTVFVDGKSIISTNLKDGYNDVKFPQGSTRGYSIQFRVQGKGILQEIEYVVEGGQNG